MAGYDREVESEQEAWILSTIRHAGGMARSDLADRTGLSRAALETRLKSLLERGLIRDAGPGTSSGGRRPRLVVFGKDAAHVVAVDLGATSLDVAITNLNADTRVHLTRPADVREGPELVLAQIKELIAEAITSAGVDPETVKGIGMGVPGPVEFRTGLPVSPPIMPGWHAYPIRRYFEDVFGWPVFVDNDVNVMALGERWSGLGRQVENFIFVKIGTGIGCGIICHGDIYRGADGCAGDIGHIAVTNEQVVCRCGNVGCLEAVAGGAALAREAERAASDGSSPYLAKLREQRGCLSARELGIAVSHGDPVAVQLVRMAGSTIGQTLAGLVNFYNPALIVIGGEVANLGDLLLASVREAVYRRSLPLATRRLVVQRSALGANAGVVGAAAVVLEELFRIGPIKSAAPADYPSSARVQIARIAAEGGGLNGGLAEG